MTFKHTDQRGEDYKPSNCRWATPKEQFDNSNPRPSNLIYRNSKTITYRGKTKTVSGWGRHFGMSTECLNYRISAWGIKLAFETPKRKKGDA